MCLIVDGINVLVGRESQKYKNGNYSFKGDLLLITFVSYNYPNVGKNYSYGTCLQ